MWSVLGWNIHLYHSHLDVHPPVPADQPDRFVWHQDGGHARSTNRSALTRQAAFFAYTYRWITTREHLSVDLPALSPVQQQLLGTLPESDGDHAWAYRPDDAPLYSALGDTGALPDHQ